MTNRDGLAMLWRELLLVIPMGLVANVWRNPSGPRHVAEISIAVLCVVARERISYNWWKKLAAIEKEAQRG